MDENDLSNIKIFASPKKKKTHKSKIKLMISDYVEKAVRGSNYLKMYFCDYFLYFI